MLVQCWAIVYDAGPALYQHWGNVSCLQQGCGLTVLTGWHEMLAECCPSVGAALDEQQHGIHFCWYFVFKEQEKLCCQNIYKREKNEKENEWKKWRKYEAIMITGVATGISFQISHFRRPNWYPFPQVRGLTYGKNICFYVSGPFL